MLTIYNPQKHRYLTKNVNSYFGLINTLSTNCKENKKGINQSNADLSPFVASMELHSNQMWRDLRELHKLAKLFKMLKIKDFDQNKRGDLRRTVHQQND